MISDRYDDHREGPSPVPPGSGAASRSRLRTRLQSMIALVFCCGVLWWTVQAVLTDNRTTKDAIRAMGSWNASERVGAIQELETAGLGLGKIAIPPLVVALGDKDARVRTAAAAALGPIGSDTASSGEEREAVGAAIMALLGSLKDPDPSVRAAAANALVTLPVGGRPGVAGPSAFGGHGDPRRTDRRSRTPDSTGGHPDHGGPRTRGRGRPSDRAGRRLAR
jgi:hypothetical protein